jgi:hypothetical protein
MTQFSFIQATHPSSLVLRSFPERDEYSSIHEMQSLTVELVQTLALGVSILETEFTPTGVQSTGAYIAITPACSRRSTKALNMLAL